MKIFSGHSIVTKKLVQNTIAQPDSTNLQLYEQFGKDLGDHIKYPAITRERNITGRVIAIFSVDDNGNLQYLKIVRSISNSLSEEVFSVIKQSAVIKKMPGNWVVPVFFTLGYEDGSLSAISISLPASETEPKTFEYNPNNIPSPNGLKILNEVVIRGYVKLKKN
ncbi:energy transducer TonB [Mucilaginibacter panaciglaebae]|uniref:TonB C-terminal domain-containing protein n=1 Tax=Mucilaginibacter panaciglaebae TaxID=502331 RepID=A0ABP7WGA9_9SPHI